MQWKAPFSLSASVLPSGETSISGDTPLLDPVLFLSSLQWSISKSERTRRKIEERKDEMSQCVPSWDLDESPNPPTHLRFNNLPSPAPRVRMPDYEVAELTWENGHLALHGLGHHRIQKPIPKDPSSSAAAAAAWEKPRPTGTLESVVDQATRAQLLPPAPSPDFDTWLAGPQPQPQPHRSSPPVMDALVPCAAAAAAPRDEVADPGFGRKRARVGEAGLVCASQGSAVAPLAGRGGQSNLVTLDTCGGDDVGFTTTTNTNSASPSRAEGEDGGSPETENTSFGGGGGGGGGRGGRLLAFDDLDSVCLSRRSQADGVCADEEKVTKGSAGRLSLSTRRSRAAAIHNQSERKRRDRINQRMKTLQKLVPNSSKTDKASMLDEVIEYLKQLQAQVNMMSRMSTMMMPMTMPQLPMPMMAHMVQMAQMAQMGMGMGMMDLNSLGRPGHPALPPLIHPSAFLPLPAACWDGAGDRMQQPGGTVLPDPFSAFLAYQTAQQQQQQQTAPPPPVSMDAYNRMAALYQQLYQQPPQGNPKP